MFADDIRQFPVGSVIDGATIFKKISDEADYIIIGSGAAGATAAQYLTSEGFSVIILEEGPWVYTKDFGVDVYPGMKALFRDVGTQVAQGRAIFPVIQGRCVGGSTTVNSAIAWRAPEYIFEEWEKEFGLGATIRFKSLEQHFDFLDKALTVKPVEDDALGNHNSLFGQAADKLGFPSQRIRRYDSGCEASAGCLTGCRSGKKQAMNVAFIPASLRRGAKIYFNTSAIKIKLGRKVITSVGEMHAKRGVILAASAIQTPGILKQSGLRNKALGQHFQMHPGTSIVGVFDQDISMQTGATQGYNSTHFVRTHGFKIEALSLPPELIAMRIPYLGKQLQEAMQDYGKILNWALVVKAKAQGSVKRFWGKDWISYTALPEDMKSMRDGYKKLSEMMFAVGAREVWPCIHGMPILRSVEDLKLWDSCSVDPRDYSMMGSHLFGTTRMGPDPASSVVGLDFQVHNMPGVYVLDSSIFPTNIGVNPQHTIMAVARLGIDSIMRS